MPQALHALVPEAFAAADRIAGSGVLHTRLLPSSWAAQQSRAAQVLLKLENQQVTGSFKPRGAVNKVGAVTIFTATSIYRSRRLRSSWARFDGLMHKYYARGFFYCGAMMGPRWGVRPQAGQWVHGAVPPLRVGFGGSGFRSCPSQTRNWRGACTRARPATLDWESCMAALHWKLVAGGSAAPPPPPLPSSPCAHPRTRNLLPSLLRAQ